MNKRQYKKWRKKHFITIQILVGDITRPNRNRRIYSMDVYDRIMEHHISKNNPILKQQSSSIFCDLKDDDNE